MGHRAVQGASPSPMGHKVVGHKVVVRVSHLGPRATKQYTIILVGCGNSATFTTMLYVSEHDGLPEVTNGEAYNELYSRYNPHSTLYIHLSSFTLNKALW